MTGILVNSGDNSTGMLGELKRRVYRVPPQDVKLESYSGIISDSLLAEATQYGDMLRGSRVVHVNTTQFGGGVAEILRSLVPLSRGIGIDAAWYVIEPEESSSPVCKVLHHCLQGDSRSISSNEMELYLAHNERSAHALATMGIDADLWIVHDVQLLPLLHCLPNRSCAVWVCHVDVTEPNESVRELLLPYIREYQSIVVSMPQYRSALLDSDRVATFPPAIDPLLPKHRHLSCQQARYLLSWLGIDEARPLISQVSRFDRWKDPCGVIDAYRMAREEISGLQLALVGAMTAKDDPDALEVFTTVQKYAGSDPDIHLFSSPLIIGDIEVNAFQSGSDVILQKSIREGFGLTVTEAMWKGTPVIAGDCGGIRLQICDGENGYLVGDVPSCARRIVSLIKDRALARQIGNAGRESVRERYLMPRLLRDYLNLSLSVLNVRQRQSTVAGSI